MIVKQLVVGFMEVFCYILGCEETQKALLIDPAGDEERIVDTARGLGLTIESVVNTHGHPDHTCGNAKIKDLTGAKIYMHALDDRMFNTPEGQSMARQMGFAISPPADAHLEDGSVVSFGNRELAVLHTPGHSPGGVCLYGENNLFYGGHPFCRGRGKNGFAGRVVRYHAAIHKREAVSYTHLTLPTN